MSLPTPYNPITPTDFGSARASSEAKRVTSVIAARETELTNPWARIEAAVASACGTRHPINEDAHSSLDGSAPVFVVADGVGGGALAARVSSELVTRLHGELDHAQPTADSIRTALLAADHEIARSIASRTEASGAATVAMCTSTNASLSRWLISWVGDCRIYRIAAAGTRPAELLTLDDTYHNLHEPPPVGGAPHDPARMVGNGAVDAPNVREVDVHAGDMLVLCSDGAHKHANPTEIARMLREPGTLARRCARVIELARAHGSHDDATVLVVRLTRRNAASSSGANP